MKYLMIVLEDKKLIAKLSAGDLLLKKHNIALTALLQFRIESVLSSDNKERTNKINRNDMHTVEHLQNLLHIS